LGLSRRKDWVLLGFILLKSHLRSKHLLNLSKAHVMTRILDVLGCSKKQPPWGFHSLKLGSSKADDRKFRKKYYVCTFKILDIICSVKFDQRHTMKIMYLHKVRIFDCYISLSHRICLLQRESFLSRTNHADLGFC